LETQFLRKKPTGTRLKRLVQRPDLLGIIFIQGLGNGFKVVKGLKFLIRGKF